MIALLPSLLLGTSLAFANPINVFSGRTPVEEMTAHAVVARTATTSNEVKHDVCEFAFGTQPNSFMSNFSRIVTFGDSISDSGRGYELSSGTQPNDNYYFGQNWSNGPVYPRLLSERMGVDLLGCAIGGATSNNTRAPGQLGGMPVDAGIDQVKTYVAALDTDIADRLHIVLVGQNNINAAPSSTGADAVEDIQTMIGDLMNAGAAHILLFNLGAPFLGEWAESMRDAIEGYYPDLGAANPNVAVVDIYTVAGVIDSSYEQFGFNETTRGIPCLIAGANDTSLPSVCNDPNERVFWDRVHPSARTHSLYAAAALATLKNKGWAWRV